MYYAADNCCKMNFLVKVGILFLLNGLWVESYLLPDKTLSFYGPKDLEHPSYVANRDGYLMSKKQAVFGLKHDNMKAQHVLNDLSILNLGKGMDMDDEESIPYVKKYGNNFAVLASTDAVNVNKPPKPTVMDKSQQTGLVERSSLTVTDSVRQSIGSKNEKTGKNLSSTKSPSIGTTKSTDKATARSDANTLINNNDEVKRTKTNAKSLRPASHAAQAQIIGAPRTLLQHSMVVQPRIDLIPQIQSFLPAAQPSVHYPVDSRMLVNPSISAPVQLPSALQPGLPLTELPQNQVQPGNPGLFGQPSTLNNQLASPQTIPQLPGLNSQAQIPFT